MPRRQRERKAEERGVSTFGGRWRSTAVITAGALVASLCLVASPAGAATQPTGTLTVEAPGVTVLKKGTPDFTKGKTNQKVGIGDTIQTDASGLAQITFKDGTLTRLDHDSIFTLDKLVNTTGKRQVEGTVSAGQTWNRVQKLSENESFQQKGNGASAVVGGTAFVTKCSLPTGTVFTAVKTKKQLKKLQKASKCDFTLVDGKLTLTGLGKSVPMNGGQSTTVDATGNPGRRGHRAARHLLQRPVDRHESRSRYQGRPRRGEWPCDARRPEARPHPGFVDGHADGHLDHRVP